MEPIIPCRRFRLFCLLLGAALAVVSPDKAFAQEPSSTGRRLVVHAGDQHSEEINGAEFAIRLLSRPHFSAEQAGAPSIEIGSAGLSFIRDETGTGIVLIGKSASLLPVRVALDANGRSEQPMDIVARFDAKRQEITFIIDGVTATVAAEISSAGSAEVAIAAGASVDWVIEHFETKNLVNGVGEDNRNASDGFGREGQKFEPDKAFGKNWTARNRRPRASTSMASIHDCC